MKKRNYLLAMTIFCMALVSSQSMMAKKVIYMGHQYNGKVNKEKVPEGEGEIDINGLVIKGVFEGNKVTSASFSKDWLKYEGELIFDENDSIILKSGSVITKYYYSVDWDNYYLKKHIWTTEDFAKNGKSLSETLEKDMVISPFQLSNLTLDIPMKWRMEGVPDELNPPIIPFYSVQLNNYQKMTNSGNYIEDIALYVINSDMQSNDKIVTNYKDDQGRVWNYQKKASYSGSSYKVTYPDGSYCSNSTHGYRVKDYRIGNEKVYVQGEYPDGSFVVRSAGIPDIEYSKQIYPDSMVVQYYYSPTTSVDVFEKFAGQVDYKLKMTAFYDLGNGLIIEHRSFNKHKEIHDLFGANKDRLTLPDGDMGPYHIYSKTYNFESMSKQELLTLLNEKLFPYTSNKARTSWTIYFMDYETGKQIVDYSKGEIINDADKAAKGAKYQESIRNEYNNHISKLKKAYGTKYVDDAINGKLYVGMPLDILCDTELWDAFAANYGYKPFMSDYTWSVYKRNTTLGIYRIQRWNKRKGIHDYFIVRVRNGKITRIDND